MTLKVPRFELKAKAPDPEGDALFEMWRSIDEFEAIDLASAATPEQVAKIKAEAAADRETIKAEIKAQQEQLEFEVKWGRRWQENPLATDMVGLLAEAKTDEDVYSFLKAIADRFATAAMPEEPVEADWQPAPIDSNNPAPAAMRRLNPAKQLEIEQEMASALAARKAQAASHTEPLGTLRPPPDDERSHEHIRYTSRTAVEPVDWEEIKRRPRRTDERR